MKTRWLAVLAVTSAAALFVVVGGCQKITSSTVSTSADRETAPRMVASQHDATTGQAGALLWSQNCVRCHNLRNPRERSDREWDVIVHHMRVRGNLTAEEHRLILAFLQSAN